MTEEAGSKGETHPTRRRLLGGLAWTGGSQVVGQVVRMVVAVALARILAPEDYGLAAIALVFASLVLVFSDLALGAALVQRPSLTEDDRSTAFWMTVGTGMLFTVVGVLAAKPTAAFYGNASVAPLCAVLSVTFVITSLGATHEALMVRRMAFGQLERRTMAAGLVGAAVGIGTALATRSAWAIIAQQVAEAIVSTILLWAFSPWRPRWRFSRASARSLGGFSGYLVGHRLLYYFHRNADNILIGRFIGPAALGAYVLAYNLMLFPFSRIAGPVQRVLAPAFARMQDEPERLAGTWLRAVRLLASLSVPALAGLVVVAPEFVRLVLGEKWAAVVPIIQVLAWVGIVQSLQSLNTDVLQALGRTSAVFRFTIIFSTTHLIAFVIGLQWGVVGVAVAYAVSTTLVEPIYTVMTARSVGSSLGAFLRAVRGVFAAGLVMVIAVAAVRYGLVEAGASGLVRLVLSVGAGGLVYLAVYPKLVPEGWADVDELLGGRLRRRRRRAQPIAHAEAAG